MSDNKNLEACKTAEVSKSKLNDLIAEWEIEGDFLDNEHDTSYDQGIGQTYKKCASELRKVLGA